MYRAEEAHRGLDCEPQFLLTGAEYWSPALPLQK